MSSVIPAKNPFLRDRWVLLLVLIVFIACKIPHLFYPYYWDECWPYVSAIHKMSVHGASLMPGAIEPELSRGHPLLFHAVAAVWVKIFGESHLSLHSFALTISILFLIAIYEAGLRIYNRRVAVMAVLLVATQVIFFIQSSFVLLEISVAFLAFLSLYFYVQEKYIGTILSLAALFYTKESGLIMGAVLGLDAVVGLFNTQKTLKKRLLDGISVLVPCILIGIFFLLQKKINGWYVFPLYTGLVEHTWGAFWYKFKMCCVSSLVIEDYRYCLYYLVLALAAVAAVIWRSFKPLIAFVPLICLIVFYTDRYTDGVDNRIVFAAFNVILLAVMYAVARGFARPEQRRFFLLAGWFVLAFLSFTALNLYIYRYLLAAIIPFLVLLAIVLDMLIERSARQAYYPVIAGIIGCAVFSFKKDTGWGDTDLLCFRAMEVQQGTVDYMEQHNLYHASVGAGGFLDLIHLKDPATGFLKNKTPFTDVKWDIDAKTEYILFNNIESDSRYDAFKNDTAFQRVFRVEKNGIWSEIYQRKP